MLVLKKGDYEEALKGEFLKNDYIIIDKIYKLGWISDNQYKILKL